MLGSPIVGVTTYEQQQHLPPHYLNALITARGDEGAFQRLERGVLGLDDFYEEFGRELSDVELGNRAYRTYCNKTGQGK